MPFNIGFPEMLIILVIALIIFGPRKLPEIGGAVGKAMREFRRASSELTDELTREVAVEKEREGRKTPAPEAQDIASYAPEQTLASNQEPLSESSESPLGPPQKPLAQAPGSRPQED